MNTLIQAGRSNLGGQLLAVPLALLSSIGSIAVAVMVGWQRGAVMSDRLLMASINVIAVLAAQLLPALASRQTGLRKARFLVVWALCLAWAVLGHAFYLLATQERAGQARADAVRLSQAPLVTPARDLPAILNDKAEITNQLARLPTLACGTAACANRQRLRAEALNERLVALSAEAQLVADFGQLRRNQQEQRRQAMDDLVGSRLSAVFGLSYSTVTSAMALGIAFILEGVGCLCWALICRDGPAASIPAASPSGSGTEVRTSEVTTTLNEPEASKDLVTDVTIIMSPTAVDTSHDSPSTSGTEARSTSHDSVRPASSRARDFHEDVVRVTAAFRDSTIPLNVIHVRDFLGCAQSHARKVRDFVVKQLDT